MGTRDKFPIPLRKLYYLWWEHSHYSVFFAATQVAVYYSWQVWQIGKKPLALLCHMIVGLKLGVRYHRASGAREGLGRDLGD